MCVYHFYLVAISHPTLPFLLPIFFPTICSPVLEEVLQSLADGVPLLDGQQVLQLLSERASVNPDTGRQNLCHPLQGAEHRGAGTFCGNPTASDVLL